MIDEENREKVLRAMEHCDLCSDMPNCPECAYLREPGCMEMLKRDIVALLKAQEPRVMTPQDFDGNPMKDQYGNLPCWLESREPLVASNWCRWNEDDFIRPMMRIFRPWTSRPTDEQREATPWNNQ